MCEFISIGVFCTYFADDLLEKYFESHSSLDCIANELRKFASSLGKAIVKDNGLDLATVEDIVEYLKENYSAKLCLN